MAQKTSEKKYWARSACPYDCPDACGLLIETDGKEIFCVKGDDRHPVTRGFICQKMAHYEQTVHHKDRILYPMKRTGRKGEGAFVRISWDEAVDEICTRWKALIRDYGGECILPYSYAGAESLIQNKCGEGFFNRLGASKLIRSICSKAKGAGFAQAYGDTPGIFVNDIPESDFILIWGCNIKATWLHASAKVVEARKKGSHVVIVDTYETPSAPLAHETFCVRPGSDGALALSMACVLKAAGLIDRDFLKEYAPGFEHFLDTLDDYTPEWAGSVTGIAPERIRALALAYGRAKAPLIIFGSGYSRHTNGAINTRCISALPALTGAFKKKGGGYLGNINSKGAFNTDRLTRPDWDDPRIRSINMNQLGQALANRQSPVYSLYVYNSNPANVAPGQRQVLEGLSREDLFTVVHERFMTDTARYADILLPADTSVEHGDLITPYGSLCIQAIFPVIRPLGECRSNWDTFCLLAKGMGFKEDIWDLRNEDLLEEMIREPNPWRQQWDEESREAFAHGMGVVLPLPDPLDFKTENKKIRLYTPDLSEPVPAYRTNKSMRATCLGKNDWLALVVAPAMETLNTTFTERKALCLRRGEAALKMNLKDAADRGIKDGDPITVYNDLASVSLKAKVSEKVPEGTVVAEGIYPTASMPGLFGINALLSQDLSDSGEAATLSDNAVKVVPY